MKNEQKSLAVAFEKLLKVYKSCKTIGQYITANKYRALFVKKYVSKIRDIALYREVCDKIEDIEKIALQILSQRKI